MASDAGKRIFEDALSVLTAWASWDHAIDDVIDDIAYPHQTTRALAHYATQFLDMYIDAPREAHGEEGELSGDERTELRLTVISKMAVDQAQSFETPPE